MHEIFAERLKELRTKESLSQKGLAEALKIPKQTVNNWEKMKNFPGLEMLCKIANYFDVSIDYLVGQTKNPKRNR